MSRRTKREVAPPPRTTAGSSCTRGVPAPSAIPYPYGGPVPSGVPYSYQPSSSFPPGWFATTLSQAMASSSADLIGGGIGACPPPAAGVMDVHPDLEGWGRESRPPGGFVNYIKSPSNFVQHVLDGNQSQPINVDDAENEGATRTEKRLAWTKDEDLRLVSTWLNNSNDPIESNYKKNEQYWGDVAAVYNSTTPKNRIRQVKQVKDHFGKIKKKVGNFCCAWKEANSLYASGESKLDLMDKASKIYDNDFKGGPFMFMHCWNELKKPTEMACIFGPA